METKTLISYAKLGEWSGYTLTERPDGNWKYESHSQVQGTQSGQIIIIRPPAGWSVEDEADVDTPITMGGYTKADILISDGTLVRCLRRGYEVR